ncbi:MAG: coproporphyrinogen dehydrogenase HemZ, partial [Ruminococcus sp.]|nr:coproporphyrinogen dehydrogenase HemZ [Ruminococcus sp.]
MIDNDFKMPVALIDNSFKYEIEAILKLFFNTARFSFVSDRSCEASDSFVVAEVRGDMLIADVKLSGSNIVHDSCQAGSDEHNEFTLCRMIYHILCKETGITPPWGMMTGIRPVKKVIELMKAGMEKDEILSALSQKYEISAPKLDIAYETAINQLPILDKIDSSAISLYVSIPFCPTRCSYCSFVSHSMDSAIKLMPEYIDALCRELIIISNIVRETDTKIDTIYFGGGTPTSISAGDLRKIMET